MSDISVIIPTYNRCELLLESVRKCHEMAGGVDLEFVIIDDGSVDDTPNALIRLAEQIPNLRFQSIPNGGPGQARNIAANMATSDIVMFLGDDIQPVSEDFFRVHLDMHQRMSGKDVAILGKVIWPDKRDADVNFVMSHIQGAGGEQFGYAHFEPYTWLDWRFFYTANISVKRNVVEDWLKDGFRGDFTAAGYEDIEFAYRLHKSETGFRLYYAPLSLGTHYHPYSLDGFIKRQLATGMMARIFTKLHPEVDVLLGVENIERMLRKPITSDVETQVPDLISIIEGIKSWARWVDSTGNLGREHWHGDMLRAVFGLAYMQGYVIADDDGEANLGEAYASALRHFYSSMQRTVYVEATGTSKINFATPISLSLGGFNPKKTRLWAWASRQPILARTYRRIRGI